MNPGRRSPAPDVGLYLHIPFCRSICNYCNFNRGLFDVPVKAAYVSALIRDITREADGSSVDTIYFGGGTPSVLAPEELRAIVEACRRAFDVSVEAEITMEANPDDATSELLEGFREGGVNRLSFGVQSFLDPDLERLGRRHSANQARDAVRQARAAGLDNVSVDLMLSLPNQTAADARASVDALIDLSPAHASIYLLEVYPNAPLRDDIAKGNWSLPADDEAADMYEETFGALERAGYEHYEISNVARGARRSRHNMKYWTDGDWMAFGCAAHATRAGVRTQRVATIPEYLDRVARQADTTAQRRELTQDERLQEALFMGLRLAEGVDLQAVGDRYGVDAWARYGPALDPAVAAGLLVADGRTIRLTRRGMLLANEVMRLFV